MRQLGVGLVYLSELAPLLADSDGIVSVLEVEPQIWWEKSLINGCGSYRINSKALADIAALPGTKLIHGVGHPIGGLIDDPLDWRTPFARCADILNPPWVSEHLSFNRFYAHGHVCETSFLLPPRQTLAGVTVAVENLRRMQETVGVPVAFETGVNYLQPRTDEMSDGDFFAAIANAADCGILLDLHNLLANERNGRQSVAEILNLLPLERVWEVHVAGGMPLNGFWLDAHSGLVDEELMQLVEQTIPRLPNLGALVFEILPSYVTGVGLDRIYLQLESLAVIWRGRPPVSVVVPSTLMRHSFSLQLQGRDDVRMWEQSLAAIALGWSLTMPEYQDLVKDPGGAVIEQLVREFRSGRVARVLRYSMLAMLRHLGVQEVNQLVRTYAATELPDIFTAVEAERFAAFLQRRIEDGRLSVPFLDEVLAFERALITASLYGTSSHVHWTVDPVALIAALEAGHRLTELVPTPVSMVVEV